MKKHQLAIAVGPVVAASFLGGLLYVIYPDSSGSYNSTVGGTSAYFASGNDQLYTGMEQTIPAGQDNSNANETRTANTQSNLSRVIPSPEPRQPSDNSGY